MSIAEIEVVRSREPKRRRRGARTVLRTVHLWVGLVTALPLFLLGLTGALLVFEDPVSDALNDRLVHVQPGAATLPLRDLARRVEASAPGRHVIRYQLPRAAYDALVVTLDAPSNGATRFYVDPYSARILGNEHDERTPMRAVHLFHTRFLAGDTGKTVAGVCALLLLFLGFTGPILWWPAQILGVRSGSLRRSTFDLHNTAGIVASLALLVFGATGAIVQWNEPVANLITRIMAKPATDPQSAVAICTQVTLSPERLLGAAVRALPGAQPTLLDLSGDGKAQVRLRFPEDHTPAGRSNVVVDGCIDRVLSLQSSRTAPLAYKVTSLWNRQVHTGDIFGWPTRALAFAFSLCLPVLAITGPLLWWLRRPRRDQVRGR